MEKTSVDYELLVAPHEESNVSIEEANKSYSIPKTSFWK